jgi:hypothetical protein
MVPPDTRHNSASVLGRWGRCRPEFRDGPWARVTLESLTTVIQSPQPTLSIIFCTIYWRRA